MAARHTLRLQVKARGGDLRELANRTLLKRIWHFSARHHRRLGGFVAVSVVGALLAVSTPVLAGRVVDAIVHNGRPATVVLIAAVIAVVALAEAGIGLLTRWLSSNIGEGLILDLRTAVFDHVQRMPVAFFTRTRTGALVSRLGNDVVGAQRAFSDTLSGVVSQPGDVGADADRDAEHLVADHGAVAAADAAVPGARPPDRSHDGDAEPRECDLQRDDEHPDDGTVLGPRRDAGEAVRRPGAGVRRVRVARGPRARHRCAHVDVAVHLHELADADVGARAGAGLRPRWRARHRRAPRGRCHRVARVAAHPAVRTADRSRQRTRRNRQCPGQFRSGVRGARPDAADSAEARRGAGSRRSGGRRVRRRPLRLPVGRQGVTGLAGGGGGARRPRR